MKRFCVALLIGSTLALTALTSCASQISESATSADFAEAEPTAPIEGDAIAQKVSTSSNPAEDNNTVAQQPQLIKKAALSLDVNSIDEAFDQVRQIVAAQQGDILSMNDFGDRQRRVSFTLRVPQEKLDTALDALTAMGTIRSRSITTEDVSRQLVDIQARLSNARKSEEALRELMERSGEISDVLEVSRELSSVRQKIEQMAAQQKSLETQVRYSTITLTLESAIALVPKQPSVQNQLASSWDAATSSVGSFTTDLLQVGLWLLVYSPYVAVLLCGIAIARKVTRRSV